MKVAIYARLSDDRQGESTGISRQLHECRAMCDARDWTIVEEYTDSDLSAFQKGVQRPAYEQMLDDAGAGKFELVLVWKLDRLVRRIAEFGRTWSILDGNDVALASVKDAFDTSTTVGLIVVHILVGVAQMESENISIRSRAKHDELRRLGKGAGGPRGYGHANNGRSVVEDEAAYIREAAQRVIEGETTYGIVKDWNLRGVRTPKGGRWDPKTLHGILLQERLVGERAGVGGQIAPILRRGIWDRARSVLLSRPRQPGATARKYLLSGFLYCGEDGTRMKVHQHAAGTRYRCPDCHLSIVAAPVQEMLTEGVLTLIENSDLPDERDDETQGLLDAIDADEQSLVDLSRARYVERSLTEAEFRAARDELVERIETAKRRYLTRSTSSPYEKKEVRSLWQEADLSWRRSVFGSVIEKVTVRKATRLGRFFDPARIEVAWRS